MSHQQSEDAHKYNHEIDMLEERWLAGHPRIMAATERLEEAKSREDSQTYMDDAAAFVVRLLWCKDGVVKAQKDLAEAYTKARADFRRATDRLRKPT